MKCTLMNKNTKVLDFELDDNNSITEIYDVYNLEYAPLKLINAYKLKSTSPVKALNSWLVNRGIPSWRKNLEILLKNINVETKEELLDKAFGLSLSDQYWFRDIENKDNIEWKNINFFTNDFEYKAYLNASLSNSTFKSNVISLYSPNNTTDGMLQKAWIIDNNRRYLIKGTYDRLNTEPINEWLASQISKRLGFSYCNYEIDIIENKLVSKCENFLSEDEEIISAADVFEMDKKPNNINDLDFYIKLLKNNGISNAEEELSNLFFIDYLIGNTDRHMNNFGIIRNVNTLKWTRLTPIFDNGESMCVNASSINEINIDLTKVKFFTKTEMPISKLNDYFDFSKYDLNKLNGLSNEYKNKLIETKEYTFLNDDVINKLVSELRKRIEDI